VPRGGSADNLPTERPGAFQRLTGGWSATGRAHAPWHSYGLLPVVVLAVAAALGLGLYSAVAPRLAACFWDLDIPQAMDAVGIAPGMIVGEAGAGDGYFTLPMARRVGPEGVVYANDISRRALNSLAAHAGRERLSNIHTVEGAVDDPLFPRHDSNWWSSCTPSTTSAGRSSGW